MESVIEEMITNYICSSANYLSEHTNFEQLCDELADLMLEVTEGLTEEKNDHMIRSFKLQKDIYKLLGIEMYKIGLYMGYTIADF